MQRSMLEYVNIDRFLAKNWSYMILQPVERGRVLRRPHFLSNANTALQFLTNKRIKLVNINASDLVDGRPPVVLGLIWTIILYFQVSTEINLVHSYITPPTSKVRICNDLLSTYVFCCRKYTVISNLLSSSVYCDRIYSA